MEKDIINNILGPSQRLLSGSKGQYRYDNPDNLVVFNSNIFILTDGKPTKVWFGDIDVTLEEPKLSQLAKELNKKVYVVYEMDGRFENEAAPKIDNAVYWTDGEKNGTSEVMKDYLERKGSRLVVKKVVPENKTRDKVLYNELDFDETSFKLPSISTFRTKKKDVTPLHEFYDWVVAQIGGSVSIETLNISAVFISEKTKEELKSELTKWIKKNSPHATEYRVQSDFNWTWLAYGPNEFLDQPDWAAADRVYVRNDYVNDQQNEDN